MSHPDLELLTAEAHGLTTPEERIDVVRHLDACAECLELFARLHAEEAAIQAALRLPPASAARPSRASWFAAAAAAVLLAATVWITLRQPAPSPAPAADPRDLVARLASADARERAEAAAALLRLGEAARPALEDAVRGGDPAVRSAARSLLVVLDGGPRPEPAEDVADVPVADLLAGNDRHKRYFLIGARPGASPPPGGYRLILLIPGGDGGPDFHNFARRVYRQSLDERTLVAQLVAVEWFAGQPIVWPTVADPVDGMAFSTESFVEEVVRDVRSRHPVDPRRIFVAAWYSGGGAGGAAALSSSSVKGAWISTATYRTVVDGGKDRSIWIDHPASRFQAAQEARNRLAAAGVRVRLETYAGAWAEDIYARLRRGLEWLEEPR